MAKAARLVRAQVALEGQANRLQSALLEVEKKHDEITGALSYLRGQLDRPTPPPPDLRTEGLLRSVEQAHRHRVEETIRAVDSYREQHQREVLSPARAQAEAARLQERAVAKLIERRREAEVQAREKAERLATEEAARTRWLALRKASSPTHV